jgi:guanylate kinase
LGKAGREALRAPHFDVHIINGELDRATGELKAVVDAFVRASAPSDGSAI